MHRLSLVLVLFATAGCQAPLPECPECEPPSDALREIQGTTWLVRLVTFPEAVDGRAPGLDLDGMDSTEGSSEAEATSCQDVSLDFGSTLPAPIVGVDNAGQLVKPVGESFVTDGRTFDSELASALRTGVVRWAIRVGTLTSDEEAVPTLPLELLLVEADETIAITDGAPSADQVLRAHPIASTNARVSGSVAWGSTAATEPLGGNVLLLPFADYRLGGLAIQAIEGASLRAQIGGSFSTDALGDLFAETVPGWEDGARSFFEHYADFDPHPDYPWECRRLSAGFELEAVPVELVAE